MEIAHVHFCDPGNCYWPCIRLRLPALFCSAVVESISNILQKRARYLLSGLRAMLDEEPSRPSEANGRPRSSSGDKLHDLTRYR
jgi:hypothetical protein